MPGEAQPLPVRPLLPARASPVKAQWHSPAAVPDYLPARMLNEFVYCPRLFFYEWVESVFAHSADTLEGAFRHEKTDRRADELAPPTQLSDEEKIHSRSVMLSSDTHGLIAKIDLVEAEGGVVTPVDYKKGAPRHDENGPAAWPADRIQVCAQALILRDNGYRVNEAIVSYHGTKQRVRVAVDDALVC